MSSFHQGHRERESHERYHRRAEHAFHDFIYELSENPLIAPNMEAQWTSTQRVMGEVLMRDEKPRDIWDQHEEMLAEVAEGHGATAEKLARQHVMQAANFMVTRLRSQRSLATAPPRAVGVRARGRSSDPVSA